jgi:energy-coupling factor transport system ATP-binding protein
MNNKISNTEPVIEFNNFSFRYYVQSEPTLQDINLKIYPGQKVVILGPSGSGKSTLVHCLNGLIPFAYKGEIKGSLKVKGVETRTLDIFKLSKIVGTVLQDTDAQFVGLTVGEDIAFALENDCVPPEEMKKRVEKAAKMVGMEKFLNHSPFELSGGQKQRTTIAGALVDNVDVLLFDEPLANLDPATAKRATEIIDDLHRKTGKTIIIVEHRLEDVLHIEVDRVIVLKDGKIIADLHPHELMASNILKGVGLREPLYVSALKYAGVNVSTSIKPGYIKTLELKEEDKQKIVNWFSTTNYSGEEEKDSSSEPILKVENLNFSYERNKPVLKNINLEIREGEMVSIVGKNGAGKSTFAKVLCGFVKEDSGTITYKGRKLNDMTIKERAEIIGFVMQNPNQMITKAIVYDEIALGLRLRKVPEDRIKEKVSEVAEICGLKPFLSWPISALSYGQKKRVTIASILVLDPDIIILDEPTAGQDFKHYSEIMEFLAYLNSLGKTIILITHDMHLIMEYTDRAVVFADGEIIAAAEPSEILTNMDVIEKANLKETSLYQLSQLVGIEDPSKFVKHFINHDRMVRNSRAGEVDTVHFR